MGEDSYPYRAKVLTAPAPRHSTACHRLQQLLSVPTERHLQVPAREGHCLCQGCHQYHAGEAPGLPFQSSRAVPGEGAGMPKVCWALQLELCAPGERELLCTLLLLSCSLGVPGERELLCTALLSCRPFGRWHQGGSGAKIQALGSCLLPTVDTGSGWDRVLGLTLQLSLRAGRQGSPPLVPAQPGDEG